MRIISGVLGGRTISDIPGKGVRPAMGKTRQALFSMLEARGMRWDGKYALDLFAGAGSLAFEALSRGAAGAWLVENDAEACKCLHKNVQSLGLVGRCHIARADVRRFLRKTPPVSFDIVFVDPPYGKNLVSQALAALANSAWLNPGAFVCAEIEKGAVVAPPDLLERETERLFGQTCVEIWKARQK